MQHLIISLQATDCYPFLKNITSSKNKLAIRKQHYSHQFHFHGSFPVYHQILCFFVLNNLFCINFVMNSIFRSFKNWPTIWYYTRMAYIFCMWHDYFSLVQFSRSVVSDSLRPHESQHARPPCPSPTPRVYPNPCPSSPWCHPAISSSVIPFSSCPQSLPASGSFPMSQLSHEVAKALEFQLQHQSFQSTPRTDLL